jgi:hypothetical protein
MTLLFNPSLPDDFWKITEDDIKDEPSAWVIIARNEPEEKLFLFVNHIRKEFGEPTLWEVLHLWGAFNCGYNSK